LISNFKKKIKDNKNKMLKSVKLNYDRSLIIIDMSKDIGCHIKVKILNDIIKMKISLG